MSAFRWLRTCLAGAAMMAFVPAPASGAASSKSYTNTRYPLVLIPGVLGFDRLFGVADYFFGIPSSLRSDGAEVYVLELSAFASVEERGEQVLKQLRYVTAVSGAEKLNIVAHSQGGLDARYAMAARPDLFASLTTISTPHRGAPLADFLLENTSEAGFSREALVTLGNAAGFFVNLLGGSLPPENTAGLLRSMSSAGVGAFNARFPAGLPTEPCGDGAATWHGVKLYSWGGTAPFTNALDPTDYFFGLSSLIAEGSNDGLVERCSGHFGHVIRDDYKMNHGDEVNQVAGFANMFETNPISTFRTHANRLRNDGL